MYGMLRALHRSKVHSHREQPSRPLGTRERPSRGNQNHGTRLFMLGRPGRRSSQGDGRPGIWGRLWLLGTPKWDGRGRKFGFFIQSARMATFYVCDRFCSPKTAARYTLRRERAKLGPRLNTGKGLKGQGL